MGKTNRRNHIYHLIQRDGKFCHYCKVETERGRDHDHGMSLGGILATKDHIVPKSMGGLGTLANFVLACKDCNEKRGDNLYYCMCNFCTGVIADYMNRNFGGTFGPTKPRVFKHHDGTWIAAWGLNSYGWKTWESAMRCVPSAEKVNV